MSFLARWLSSAWILSLAFVAALVVMQAPALTDAYMAALLQVSSDARADVDQRIASARRYYGITGEDERQVIGALARSEPSNAETLRLSSDRTATLRAAYDRLAAAPALLRPALAVTDAAVDPDGYKRNVLRLVFESYVPTVPLSLAALVYGVAGVVFGSFLGHVALAALGGIGGRLGRIGRRRTPWYVPPRETRLRY
jgi:hypothetical protein